MLEYEEGSLHELTNEQLALRGLELDVQIKQLQARLKVVKALSMERYRRALGEHPEGNIIVRLIPNRKFDPELAEQLLTEEELAKVSRYMVDRDLAKDKLSPEDYRACSREHAPKVGYYLPKANDHQPSRESVAAAALNFLDI